MLRKNNKIDNVHQPLYLSVIYAIVPYFTNFAPPLFKFQLRHCINTKSWFMLVSRTFINKTDTPSVSYLSKKLSSSSLQWASVSKQTWYCFVSPAGLMHVVYGLQWHWFIWSKVFQNGPSKICGRQPLENFTRFIIEYFVPYRLLL